MKIKLLIAVVCVILFAFDVSAQNVAAVAPKSQSGTIWTVDFIKSKPGQQTNFLKYIEQNWAAARQMLREKGSVISYQVFSLPQAEPAEWDVLLLTEYADRETYERREAIFAEVFKVLPTVPVNGMTSGRQMADIKFDKVLSQPISSETARIMPATETANQETAAARVPLENYLKAHETGNGEFAKKAFHTEGNMTFVRDGKYTSRTFAEYISGFTGKPAPDEQSRKRRIESIEIAGNVGFGKIVLDYPNVKFVDYMTLLKIDGEWKIVNKSFYAEPKNPPPAK